jgi:hypothetical protein
MVVLWFGRQRFVDFGVVDHSLKDLGRAAPARISAKVDVPPKAKDRPKAASIS